MHRGKPDLTFGLNQFHAAGELPSGNAPAHLPISYVTRIDVSVQPLTETSEVRSRSFDPVACGVVFRERPVLDQHEKKRVDRILPKAVPIERDRLIEHLLLHEADLTIRPAERPLYVLEDCPPIRRYIAPFEPELPWKITQIDADFLFGGHLHRHRNLRSTA